MIGKIWKYFKYFAMALGFLSLALILYVSLSLIFVKGGVDQNEDHENKQPVEIYKKAVGDMDLKISREVNNNGRLLVSIARGKSRLVTDYVLPTEQYELDWLQVTDADILPLSTGEYGVVLFSAIEECDHCDNGNYIWLLKLDNKMSLVTMLPLLDMHKTENKNTVVLANKAIYLPYIQDAPQEQIIIPIKIEIGQSIKIAPMLDQESTGLFKQHFGKIIDKRLEKLSQSSESDLLEKYTAAAAELNKYLSPQTISY